MKRVIRRYDPARDADDVAALWKRVFGSAVGGQTPEWLFRPGPAGDSVRIVADLDGRLVGHAGAFPLRFTLMGESVRGAYSVAAMTDPSAQRLGLYLEMGTRMYEELAREGFAFVAGFSNARSEKLITGALGRHPVRPFPWCVRLLQPIGLARALLRRTPRAAGARETVDSRQGSLKIEASRPDDERLDALWSLARPDIRIGAIRDSDFGRWRFNSRRDADYHSALVSEGGEVVAGATYRLLTLRGIPAAFLMDLVVRSGAESAAGRLLEAIQRDARSQGAVLMSALVPGHSPARSALRKARYIRIPERFHPQTIRFSALGLGGFEPQSELCDPRSWFLSWADTDVV